MSDSFVTPWTVVPQAPLSIGFSRQEFWSGLPFPSPEDVPDPETEPASPGLAGRFLATGPRGSCLINVASEILKTCGHYYFVLPLLQSRQ